MRNFKKDLKNDIDQKIGGLRTEMKQEFDYIRRLIDIILDGVKPLALDMGI